MTYSILVATMNRPNAVANLLDSIEKQAFLPQEFILIDQSKDERTQKICEAYLRRISSRGQRFKYVRQDVPCLVRARNRCIDESTGDILCFVDDDVILNRDYFERVAFYFQDSAIGGVTGNVRVEKPLKGFKWEVRKFIKRMFLLNSFDGRLTPSTFGYPIYEREISEVMEVELFAGYSMNYRRELVLRNRPDEWFRGYGYREDVDLSYRISRDAKLIIVPDAKFIHDVSMINRLETGALKKMQAGNHLYLFKKFQKYGLASWILYIYSIAGVVLIDFLEFLFNFNKNKWEIFAANFSAIPIIWSLKVEKSAT